MTTIIPYKNKLEEGGLELVLLSLANEYDERVRQKIIYHQHNYKHMKERLADAEKVNKMSEDNLIKLVKTDYEHEKEQSKKEIEKLKKKIPIFEEALKKIDLVLEHIKDSDITEDLKRLKKGCQEELDAYKGQIYYYTQNLNLNINSELIAKQKEEIPCYLASCKEEINNEKAELRTLKRKAIEYRNLYAFLTKGKTQPQQ